MVEIREDDLTGSEIVALLQEHLDNMRRITPPGSVYAYDLERLRSPDVTVWSAWDGGQLLGCAALQELSSEAGELKSLRTADGHRRKGVGTALLRHVIAEGARRSYRRLHLETGATLKFAAARSFYERHGFVESGPFGEYEDDPHSFFMVKEL